VKILEEEPFDLQAALGIGLAVSTVLLVFVRYVFAGRIVRPVAEINRITFFAVRRNLERVR
jgi:hypothetical protein